MIRSGQGNPSQYYNPWRVLLDIYNLRDDKKSQLDVLNTLLLQYPDDAGLKARINELKGQTGVSDTGTSRPAIEKQ
jgi:hypothetical protein